MAPWAYKSAFSLISAILYVPTLISPLPYTPLARALLPPNLALVVIATLSLMEPPEPPTAPPAPPYKS